MNLRIVTALAVGMLLAACQTPPAQQAAAPMDPREYFETKIGNTVYFDYDRWDLRKETQAGLWRQAEFLIAHPEFTVLLEGHCDERGTKNYNYDLGAHRAAEAKEYLIAQGVDPGRIDTVSYGKDRPAIEDSGERSWRQNRRVVTILQ
ncbi:MAG: OmpA family protein [Dongiaceae bacterium]